MTRSAARLGRQLLRGLSFALVILVAAGGWALGSFSAAPAVASPSPSVVPLPDNAGSISTHDYRGDFERPPPVLSDAAAPSGPAAERGRVRRASSGLEVLACASRAAGLADDATIAIGKKVSGQMGGRGWTRDLIDDTLRSPSRTVVTRDTRWTSAGTRMDDPATAYVRTDRTYVVRNDITGDIVQISNRNDPNWVAPWD